jgi:hypothetical protein
MGPVVCETNLTQILVPSIIILLLMDIHIHIKLTKSYL